MIAFITSQHLENNLFYLADGVRNGAIILYRNGSTSSSYYYGIVRVAYNGWGNICDDFYYSSTEANVICHQLGFTGASSYSRAGLVKLELSNTQALHYLCLAMALILYL